MCHRSYNKGKRKNKKLQVELDKKEDTQELEQMITNLKVQIEEDKRIEEVLKEHLYEEEAEDEEEVEGEDEEDQAELEEQVQQVSPNIPTKRVQKNHPSYEIIENKDAGVDNRSRIHSPKQTHLALSSTIEPNSFEKTSKDEFLE